MKSGIIPAAVSFPPVPSDAPGFGLRFSIRSIAFFTRSGEAFIWDMMRCECFIVNSEK